MLRSINFFLFQISSLTPLITHKYNLLLSLSILDSSLPPPPPPPLPHFHHSAHIRHCPYLSVPYSFFAPLLFFSFPFLRIFLLRLFARSLPPSSSFPLPTSFLPLISPTFLVLPSQFPSSASCISPPDPFFTPLLLLSSTLFIHCLPFFLLLLCTSCSSKCVSFLPSSLCSSSYAP